MKGTRGMKWNTFGDAKEGETIVSSLMEIVNEEALLNKSLITATLIVEAVILNYTSMFSPNARCYCKLPGFPPACLVELRLKYFLGSSLNLVYMGWKKIQLMEILARNPFD